VRDILRRVSIPVQVGGGLRTRELAERVLNQGVDRIVLSTSDVARDDAFLLDMLARYGEKIVVGADSRNGFVAAEGFTARVAETIDAFGRRLVQAGVRRFLFSNEADEEEAQGTNVEATLAFARAVAAGGARVLASGVKGPTDIENLTPLQPHGVEGVIIGKALYGGALTLDDAVRIAAQKGGGAGAGAGAA
jgi:phosphoribosylformimino-5-aminoimidazole carboxamide ribotide isomerase